MITERGPETFLGQATEKLLWAWEATGKLLRATGWGVTQVSFCLGSYCEATLGLGSYWKATAELLRATGSGVTYTG